MHFFASRQPIPYLSASELAKRLPPSAAADLVEWGPLPTAEQIFAGMLRREVPIGRVIALDSRAPAMEDDRPVNEYDLLRSQGARRHWSLLETSPETVGLWFSQLFGGSKQP